MSKNHFEASERHVPNPTMSRNQTGGTELIPMPHPTEAAQLSLPIILYSAVAAPPSSSYTPGSWARGDLAGTYWQGDSEFS